MSEPKIRLSQVSPSASGSDRITGNVAITGSINVATANITTIVTGNALTLSTGTGSNGNIVFSANGTEDMRITPAGGVGIGTTNPNSLFKLDVTGRIQANGDVYISGDGGEGYVASRVVLRTHNNYRGAGIFMVGETSAVSNNTFYIGTPYTDHGSGLYFRHTANNYQTDYQSSAYTAAGNTLMYLAPGGNVGIGTANPGYKLTVDSGAIFAGRPVSDTGSISFSNTAAIFSSLGVDHTAARTNVLRLMRDGTPSVVFAGFVDFDISRWEASSVNSRTALHLKLGHGIISSGEETDVMTLLSSGNVGVGTTNPTAQGLTIHQGGGDRRVLLELNRPNTPGLQTAIEFTVGGSIMVGRIQHEYEAANQNHMSFSLRSPGSTNYEALRLQNNGTVGIGTTNPSSPYRLTLNGGGTSGTPVGGIAFRQGGTDTAYIGSPTDVNNTDFEIWNPRNGYLRFATNNSERVRISADGVVTTANQPAFVAFADTNQEPTSTTKLAYTGITLNRGNHYNSSTSRFTAPVTGIYSFNVRWWYKVNATGLAQLFVYKNGGGVIETRFRQAASVADYITQLFKTTMYLIAGDYIEVYATGNGTDSFHSSTSYYYSEFSGYLLG